MITTNLIKNGVNHLDYLAIENFEPVFINNYSREYYIAEKPWYEESIKLKANISMFRLPWVVGKGSWFYHHYIQIALKYGYVPLYSKGENWMSLLDVNDCCSLALHLSKQSKQHRANSAVPGKQS